MHFTVSSLLLHRASKHHSPAAWTDARPPPYYTSLHKLGPSVSGEGPGGEVGVGVVGSSYIVRRTCWMPVKCCRRRRRRRHAAAASDPQMGKKPRLTLEEVPFGARSYLHCQCTVECLLTGGGGGDTGWSTANNIPILTYDSIAQMPQKGFFFG